MPLVNASSWPNGSVLPVDLSRPIRVQLGRVSQWLVAYPDGPAITQVVATASSGIYPTGRSPHRRPLYCDSPALNGYSGTLSQSTRRSRRAQVMVNSLTTEFRGNCLAVGTVPLHPRSPRRKPPSRRLRMAFVFSGQNVRKRTVEAVSQEHQTRLRRALIKEEVNQQRVIAESHHWGLGYIKR